MSMISLAPLGQEVQPQPLVEVTPEIAALMQGFWNKTRAECERVLSPAQCAQLLGYRPTILPAGEVSRAPFGIAWWGWLGIGVIIGKIVL